MKRFDTVGPAAEAELHRVRQERYSTPVLLIGVFLFAIFTIVAGGCRTLPPPARDQVDAFASAKCPSIIPAEFVSSCAKAPGQNDTPTKAMDLYIDGSGSMHGFAVPQASNFRMVVREVIESAEDHGFAVSKYKFTSAITDVSGDKIGQIEAPGFYDGQDTPLAALIDRIASQPRRTSIVISDLVQSQQGRDVQALIGALLHLTTLRPEIKLLAYRSDFDGRYTPESGGPGTLPIQLKMSQSIVGNGRPFYILVVAPNQATMDSVQDNVLNRVPPAQFYDPTAPPLTIDNIQLDGNSAKDWTEGLPFSLVVTDGGLPGLNSAFHWMGGEAAGDSVSLPLVLTTTEVLPLRDPSRLDLKSYRISWSRKGPTDPVSVDLREEGRFDSEHPRSILHLQLRLPRPRRDAWDVYLIALRAGQGNLDPPSWVDEWDTEDDSAASAGNRTYQLKVLTECLVHAVSEKSVAGVWTLDTIEGRRN